jgi:hypothetical protein
MNCVECNNNHFDEVFGINYETFGANKIFQCCKCGRYKFFEIKECD